MDTVASVDAAIERLSAVGAYDVYLCDLMMPEKDGRAFHEYVTESLPGQERRVLFVTGGALGPELVEFLDSVENGCLDKPVAPARLEQAVVEVLRSAAE